VQGRISPDVIGGKIFKGKKKKRENVRVKGRNGKKEKMEH
jgi:hypothetical protein